MSIKFSDDAFFLEQEEARALELAGARLAQKLMREAAEMESATVVSKEVYMLRHCAIALLATEAFTHKNKFGVPFADYMGGITDSVHKEMHHIEEVCKKAGI